VTECYGEDLTNQSISISAGLDESDMAFQLIDSTPRLGTLFMFKVRCRTPCSHKNGSRT
jgi:hypothetical protein